ncbi:hypothetical protein QBC42DRAFT_314305 [Cladorrhinum samala]|uniref:Uncharacterized protein n=1 Tax=Cladorrhinum samala TaxID=585594 RepID=A0AAV9HHK4_9PEZI|nr:hypothetical protein QBC42DRAFT_314305 [Cladorrhinum samala]
MAVFCCCTSRPSKARASAQKDHHQAVLPSPPPPARLPGPLSLNPATQVSAGTSPRSLSSLQPSMPAAMAPLEPVELGELVIEDSDSEEDPDPYTQNKSTSTLQLVKTKIRRHLSQDSLSRRKARSAVGSSQEEVERRAELKRLMHKRIQEELRSEEGQDSSPSETSSAHRHPIGLGIDHLPGGGPRDNIEFSVSEESRPGTPCASRPGSAIGITQREPEISSLSGSRHLREQSSLPQMPVSPGLPPRRHSSTRATSSLGSWRLSYSAGQLDELLGYVDEGIPPGTAEALQNSAVSAISSAPFSSPQSLQLPGHAHSLSRSHSSPARQGAQESDSPYPGEQSPLSVWLRSQGLHSRSPSPARTSDHDSEQGASVQQAELVYLRRWSSVQHSAVPESDLQRPEIVHLYDMDIHRQLATRTINTPIDTPNRSRSNRDSGANSPSKQPGVTNVLVEHHSDAASEILDTPLFQPALAVQDPNGIPTQSSSVYPSASASVYPSQGTSVLHLPANAVSNAPPAELSLPGFKWLDNSCNPYAQSSSESTSRRTAGGSSVQRSFTPETAPRTRVTSPMPSSGTYGKLQRDSQLGTVEKSIGYFHLGQGAPSLIVNRFRKEAEDRSMEAAKPSFLARLHLTLPRRARLSPRGFDRTAPDIESEQEPASPPLDHISIGGEPRPYSWGSGTNHTASYHPLTPILSEYEGSADDLWRAALQENPQDKLEPAKSHSHRRGSSFPGVLRKKLQDAAAQSEHSGGGSSGYIGVASTDKPNRMSSAPVSPASFTADCGLSSIGETTGAPKENPVDCVCPPVHNSVRVHLSTRGSSLSQGAAISPAVLAPYDLCENIISAEDSNLSLPRVPEFPMPPSRSGAEAHSSDKQEEDQRQRAPKTGSLSFSGKFSKAVKFGLSKLVPSRSLHNTDGSKLTDKQRKSIDCGKGVVGPTRPDIVVPERISSHPKLTVSRDSSAPRVDISANRQRTQHDQGKIPLSTRMAALLHTNGTSGLEFGHVRDSTTTTERFVTPLGSLYTNNNDTSSFHSYPQTRSHNDIDSIRSDATRSHRHRLVNATPRGNISDGGARFNTWGGRSRTHPLLAARSTDELNL